MAGLNTAGFQMSQMPALPVIPENVGKIDVKAIYDRVNQGLQLQNTFNQNMQQQQTEADMLKAQQAQAKGVQATVPGQVSAEIAKNDVLAQANNPQVAGLTGALAPAKLQTLLADQGFQNSLTPAQRAIFAAKGIPTTNDLTVERNPDGTTVEKSTGSAALPGAAPITTNTSTVTTPTAPIISTVPGGPNGMPAGVFVSGTDASGKSAQGFHAMPLAAYNGIVAETRNVWAGAGGDIQHPTDKWQQQTRSAAGGDWVNHGPVIENLAGSGAPGGGTAKDLPRPLDKATQDAVVDAQAEVGKLEQRTLEIQNIQNSADEFLKTPEAGKFVGPISLFLGAPKAQAFVGSVQNALQTALQPLRGTGRVSQQEFNQALGALPAITDQPSVIQAKLGYIRFVTSWARERQQNFLNNMVGGMPEYAAFAKAQKETPIPELPNFASGASQTYTPPGPQTPQTQVPGIAPAAPAQGATPTVTNQQQYDALPTGSSYLGPDGSPHVKGGKPGA